VNNQIESENHMNGEENCEILYRLGFTAEEIDRLSALRRNYSQKERKQIVAEQRRLEFVRWLVTTGKLTD
jgi:hypothetical protein